MNDVSNSTLALFVVLAIVVSVFGTFMSLSKLDQLEGVPGITGFASSGSGTANVTIRASSDIVIVDGTIDFGTMSVNKTNTSYIVDDWIIIKNEGSSPLDIDVYDGGDTQGPTSDYSADAGMGPFHSNTTQTTGCVAPGGPPHTCFMIHCFNVSGSGSCTNGDGVAQALPTGAGTYFADEVPISSPDDYAFFGVNITVPIDEPSYGTTALEQTLTFSATAD